MKKSSGLFVQHLQVCLKKLKLVTEKWIDPNGFTTISDLATGLLAAAVRCFMQKWLILLVITNFLVLGCDSDDPTPQPSDGQFFTVQVVNEQFVMFVKDPATIQQAMDNFAGRNQMHPTGNILTGNGGFNG